MDLSARTSMDLSAIFDCKNKRLAERVLHYGVND